MNKSVVAIGVVILLVGMVSLGFSETGGFDGELLADEDVPVSTLSPDAKILFNVSEQPTGQRYVVELTGGMGMARTQQREVISTLSTIGVQIERQYTRVANAVTVTADPSQVEQIAEIQDVKRVYRDQLLKGINVDTNSASLAASYASGLDKADYDGSDVMVMVVDTGIRGDLPEFQRDGDSVVNAHFSVFNEQYTHWHGSFIAGILASQGTDDSARGLSPGVDLGSVCCFDDNGEAYLSDILDGLEYIVNWKNTHNQFVIASCSWGITPGTIPCSPDSPGIVCSSTAKLAERYSIPVVASAGNSGSASSTINHPAASPHVIAVGAVDSNLDVTGFSSRGPVTGLGEAKPDVVSYGYNIESIDTDGEKTTASGTSFSAPMITSVVAQMAEKYENMGYEPVNYEQALESSAEDLGRPGADPVYGHGFANATGAFDALGEQAPPTDVFFTGGIMLMAVGGVVTGSGIFADRRRKR